MKKLFSLGVMIVLVMTLAACQDLEGLDFRDDIDALSSTITSLEEEVGTLEAELLLLEERMQEYQGLQSDLQSLTVQIETLKAQIEAIEASMYDGRVTFIVHGSDGMIVRNVGFFESDEKTLFDLLISEYDVAYTSSEWGVFIDRIETLDTKYGNFISIKVNGSSAQVGIEMIDYQHNDVIEFILEWWDDDAKSVSSALDLFNQNQAHAFLDDYMVVLGLKHLGIISQYDVALSEALPEDVSGLIKYIIKAQSLGEDTEDAVDALLDLASPTGFPYTSSLVVLALSQAEGEGADDFIEAYIESVIARDVDALDLDTLSLIALALSSAALNEEAQTFLDSVKTRLIDDAFNNSFGNNAAGFANIIMALVALDVTPFEVTSGDENLVSSLLMHQADNGAFYYTLESSSVDLMFSTPQAYLSLVAVELYLNQGAVNVFAD